MQSDWWKPFAKYTTTRFQPTDTRWAEVGSRVNSIEAIRLSDPLGPTNNVRGKFLVTLVQSLAELGEPKPDQIDTLLRDMIKGLVAPTNEHRSKEGNVRMKELLEKRVLGTSRLDGVLHWNPQWVAGRDRTAPHLERHLRPSSPLDCFLKQGQQQV